MRHILGLTAGLMVLLTGSAFADCSVQLSSYPSGSTGLANRPINRTKATHCDEKEVKKEEADAESHDDGDLPATAPAAGEETPEE